MMVMPCAKPKRGRQPWSLGGIARAYPRGVAVVAMRAGKLKLGGGRRSVVDRAGFVGGEETSWELASGDTGAQGTYSKTWTLGPASVSSESMMFGASEMNN